MHHQPDGATFDIVLLLHVGCVVVGLVTTAAAAATASRLRRLLGSPLPLPEPLRRYFRPGVNWAGRTIYGIPVFGFVLLAMSDGAYALRQGWVLGGLGLFAAVALVGEGVMWPAERRLQAALAPGDAASGRVPRIGRPRGHGHVPGRRRGPGPARGGDRPHGGATLTGNAERDPLGVPFWQCVWPAHDSLARRLSRSRGPLRPEEARCCRRHRLHRSRHRCHRRSRRRLHHCCSRRS